MNINKLLSNPEHILCELTKDEFKLAKELFTENEFCTDCKKTNCLWHDGKYPPMHNDGIPAYQYHLQQLIISSDYAAYIRENTT